MHLWLKHYIMGRIVAKGERPGMGATVVTFLMSAFWHGFYVSYYIMFFFAAIMNEIAKDLFKARSLFSWIPYYPRWILANVASMACMNYCGIVFGALTFENSINFMSANYYCIYAGLVVALIFFRSINIVGIAKKMEANKNKKTL